MFHVSGLIAVLVTGAAFPTTLVFPAAGPWDPLTWLELTARHKVTTWSGVPTQFWRLLRHPDLESYDLSSVRTVGSGGAVFPPELVRELHGRFPQVRLGNGYGMSETVGLGTLTGGDPFVAVPEAVGPAQPTVEVQIRDARGDVLPEGRDRGDLPPFALGLPGLLGRPGGHGRRVRTRTAGTGRATSAGSPAACSTWRADDAT